MQYLYYGYVSAKGNQHNDFTVDHLESLKIWVIVCKNYRFSQRFNSELTVLCYDPLSKIDYNCYISKRNSQYNLLYLHISQITSYTLRKKGAKRVLRLSRIWNPLWFLQEPLKVLKALWGTFIGLCAHYRTFKGSPKGSWIFWNPFWGFKS